MIWQCFFSLSYELRYRSAVKRLEITGDDAGILEPIKSTGDGNCLFNSLSLLLVGSEVLTPLLRAMSFMYAALHVAELEKWIEAVRIEELEYTHISHGIFFPFVFRDTQSFS